MIDRAVLAAAADHNGFALQGEGTGQGLLLGLAGGAGIEQLGVNGGGEPLANHLNPLLIQALGHGVREDGNAGGLLQYGFGGFQSLFLPPEGPGRKAAAGLVQVPQAVDGEQGRDFAVRRILQGGLPRCRKGVDMQELRPESPEFFFQLAAACPGDLDALGGRGPLAVAAQKVSFLDGFVTTQLRHGDEDPMAHAEQALR